MVFRHYFYTLIVFALLALFASCANKVSPTGGEKDVQSPQLTTMAPENFSTELSAKKIRIEFDEFIQLKELNKNLIISPIIKPLPNFSVKKKTLTIELPDSLLANTTYTINFGSAIVDITEGNPLENFQYVFSTGAHIDSLFIAGKVNIASSLLTEKGILVMLYSDLSDSVPMLSAPDYFSITNEEGLFIISNLKAATYRLVALKDNNNNYRYDQPDELFGFYPDFIILPDSTPKKIRLSVPHPQKLKINKAGSKGFNIIEILLNKPAESLELTDLQGNAPENSVLEKSAYGDSIYIFLRDTLRDSLSVVIKNKGLAFDTAHIQLRKSSAVTMGRGNVLQDFSLENNLKGNFLDNGSKLILRSVYPLKIIDPEKIVLLKDSVAIENISVDLDSSTFRKIKIDYNFVEDQKYTLKILPSAIENILGKENDTIKMVFSVKPLKEYGSMALAFLAPKEKGPYILKLLDDKNKIVQRKDISSSGEYSFNFLYPGTYRLMLIVDENENGRLDPGNYWEGKQPEIVYFYPAEIKIRSNWDISISWDLSVK